MIRETPTTASAVGIVFTTAKNHVRAHIYVDSDVEFAEIQANLPAGFGLAFVPMSAHLAGHVTFHQAIAKALGHTTVTQQFTDPCCVVIDNISLRVERVILADDSIDFIPGKILVNVQNVPVGSIYNLITKQFTVPAALVASFKQAA